MKTKIYQSVGEQVFFDTLPNGLRIFVVKKPDFKKYMAFFATDYGGADRRFKTGREFVDTPAGVAHFLEHKMFDMEDGDALMKFSEQGASANAFTSGDMTAYHFECTNEFYPNLELLLKFVSTPYFTEQSVAKEQGIIGQEIKMTEDSPDFVNYYNLLRCLYKDNPVRDSVAGTVESIAEISADTLYSCHGVFYNPSNMALCVVGNADPEKIYETALNILPKHGTFRPERDYGSKDTKKPAKSFSSVSMEVALPMFLIGGKITPAKRGDEVLRKGMIASLALDCVFGPSTAFFSKYYAEGLINSEFSAEYETVANASYFMIGGESEEPEKVRKVIEEELARVSAEGIDAKLFERLKKTAIGESLRNLNSFDEICYNIIKGCFDGYDAMLETDTLASITLEDVETFVRNEIKSEYLAVSLVMPTKK